MQFLTIPKLLFVLSIHYLGSPVTIADSESFRDLMKTMDPKFKMPGKHEILSAF